jgi:uncharacterized membrane protein
MPYCTQCGKEVLAEDRFCAACGAGQQAATGSPAVASPPPRGSASSSRFQNLTPQGAATLCYIPWFGWIVSIVLLATDRFRAHRETRFHAFQGLYLFVLWLFVDQVFEPVMRTVTTARFTSTLLHLIVLGTWIFMLVKTAHGHTIRLPFLGELADRSVSEQK